MLLHGWIELHCVYKHLPHPFLCWKINVLLEEKRTRCPTCCVAAFFFSLKCPGIPGPFCQGLVLSSTSWPRVQVVNAGPGAEDKSGLTYIGHWVVSFFSHCWQEATQGSLSWLSAQWYSLPSLSGGAGSCLAAEDHLLTSWIRKQRKGKASSIDFLLFPFYSKCVSSSVGWYHPHSERVFPPQWVLSGSSLTDSPKRVPHYCLRRLLIQPNWQLKLTITGTRQGGSERTFSSFYTWLEPR